MRSGRRLTLPEGIPVSVGHAGDGLGSDVVEGDRFLARQAVVEWDQQQPGLVVEDRHVQLAGREWQPGHHRVGPVIEQRRTRLVPGQVQGLDVGVGMLAAQVAHGRGDDEVGSEPDGDQARPGGRAGSGRSLGGRSQQSLSARQKDLPGLGEPCALRGAVEQAGPELLF